MRLTRLASVAIGAALSVAALATGHAQKRPTRPTGPRQAGKPAASAKPQEPTLGYAAWDLDRLPIDSGIAVLRARLTTLGYKPAGTKTEGAGWSDVFTIAPPPEVAKWVPQNPVIVQVPYVLAGVRAIEFVYAANDTITVANVDTVVAATVARITRVLGEPKRAETDRVTFRWDTPALAAFMIVMPDSPTLRHGFYLQLTGALAHKPWVVAPVWKGHADTVERISEPVLLDLATLEPPITADSTHWQIVDKGQSFATAFDTTSVRDVAGYRLFWEATFLHRFAHSQSSDGYYDRRYSLDLVDCANKRRMTLRGWGATASVVVDEQLNWRPYWDSYAQYKGTVAEAACGANPHP